MPKRPYNSSNKVKAVLHQLRREIDGGMTDREVSERTGLPIRTIQRWRYREGLQHPAGTALKKMADIRAISAFGEALGDVKQRTTKSSVGGTWEPPAFVTRTHLDYNLFLKVLDAGARLMGLSEEQLCSGLGMTPLSVEQGLKILVSRLKPDCFCACCGDRLSPGSNVFCSTICKRVHGRQNPAA